MALDTATARLDIAKVYLAAFNRVPDSGGLDFWVNAYLGGKTLKSIADGFASSTEYTNKYPSYLTNTEYVANIYTNVFGRAADTAGQTFWANAITNGLVTKASLLNEMITAAGGTGNNDGARLANQADFGVYCAVNKVPEATGNAQLASITYVSATNTAAQAAVIGSAGTGIAGSTFTLTSSGDTLSPTSATAALKTTTGNDTFRAATDGDLTSSDYVDGGDGTDSLTAAITANSQTLAPMLKNIENITLTITAADTKATTFNAADVTGVTSLTLKDAGAVSTTAAANADELITVSNLLKTATLGITGGAGSTAGTGSAITATFASAAAADTQKVAISTLGKTAFLTLATAETVEITATGTGTTGANTIGTLSAGAVKTLNLKGAGDLTIGASDMAAVITVNASTSTGVIAFTGETAATSTTFTGGTGATTVTTASTGTINVTTGAAADTVDVSGSANTATITTAAGNDEVKVGASTNVTAADVINGGDGTDTITISDATINATTKTTLALGVSNFEYLKTTSATLVTADFVALSSYDTIIVATADAGAAAGAAGTAGTVSVEISKIENADALVIAAGRVGGTGAVATGATGVQTSGAGGNALNFTPSVDNGANAVTLKFIGDTDISGGVGGAGAAQTGSESDLGGAGGIALNASAIETLNIDVAGTLVQNAAGTVVGDVVTIAGGAGGAATGTGSTAGAAGSSLVVGTNATINITSSLYGATANVNNDINLGTVVGTNVTVNATTFAGKLTVSALDGNTTITGGTKADVIVTGTGIDTINGGLGNDQITAGDGADIIAGGGGRDSFVIVTAAHSDTVAYDKISDFGKVTTAASIAEVGAMTNNTTFVAAATAKGGAEADYIDFVNTASIGAAASGTDVSAGVTGGGTVTGAISAKGIVTVTGAQASNVDTLAEWTAVVHTMLGGTQYRVAAFEFGGNTYVQECGSGALTTDDLVQLTGVTGVTGIVAVGGAVAAAAGDIFVL